MASESLASNIEAHKFRAKLDKVKLIAAESEWWNSILLREQLCKF